MNMNRKTCGHQSKEGHVCVLYIDHYGNHKSQHLKEEWTDDK